MEKKIGKKTIVISEKTHQRIKIHCAKNNLKINDWMDNWIWMNLDDGMSELDKSNKDE